MVWTKLRRLSRPPFTSSISDLSSRSSIQWLLFKLGGSECRSPLTHPPADRTPCRGGLGFRRRRRFRLPRRPRLRFRGGVALPCRGGLRLVRTLFRWFVNLWWFLIVAGVGGCQGLVRPCASGRGA